MAIARPGFSFCLFILQYYSEQIFFLITAIVSHAGCFVFIPFFFFLLLLLINLIDTNIREDLTRKKIILIVIYM